MPPITPPTSACATCRSRWRRCCESLPAWASSNDHPCGRRPAAGENERARSCRGKRHSYPFEATIGFPGKEVVMMTITYPPGGSGPVHKHKAHGFIYVLESSVVMAVNVGEPVTLASGQTF